MDSPKNNRKRNLTLAIPTLMKEKIKAGSKKSGLSQQNYVLALLEDTLKDDEPPLVTVITTFVRTKL